MYYRGATAAIVVYDVTNPASFEGAKSWVRELQRRGDPHVVIALAANKVRKSTSFISGIWILFVLFVSLSHMPCVAFVIQADKEDKRKVTIEEGEEYARENGIIHMQTSAKTAMNVKELFLEIAKRMPKQPKEDPRVAGGFVLNQSFAC